MRPIPESFQLGVCYYPEHWPRDRWIGYARQMRELGLTYVRIAEFAWSKMEPVPGEYEWGWLDDAISVLAAEGLQVVLCTPTATPPAWLIRQHPEILPVGKDGHVRNFGGRRHYDFASPVYRVHASRITRAIAARYGEHPAIVGWQIDNEFGDHETGVSYGQASAAAFRDWCTQRYGTLDALNASWGATFWSQEYSAWNQIDPPNLTVCEPNPSHVLDYRRFSSDEVVSFMAAQVAILRALSPGRWVTHNYMRLCTEFDHYPASELLDFVSLDVYPTGAVEFTPFTEAEKIRWARTGDPDTIAFNHDLYRGMSATGAHWVMEGQVGHINWAPSNALPADGAAGMWIAQAQAHGAACYSAFRWRAATVAQELMHSGLLRHDETLDCGGEEIASYPYRLLANSPHRNRVVLLHDYESLWIYDEQPHSAGARYWSQVRLFYGALRSLGIDVDIRHPDHDLSGYELIVAPAIQLMSSERAAHLMGYRDHTRFLFGPRTAFRTMTGRVHEDAQPGPLRPLVGWTLKNFDGLRPGLVERIGDHEVTTWAESYRPVDSGADVVARYTTGPLADEAAVVRLGNVVTVGAWSQPLITELLASLLEEIGQETVHLPDGLRSSRHGDAIVWQNWNKIPMTMPDGTVIPPVATIRRNAAD